MKTLLLFFVFFVLCFHVKEDEEQNLMCDEQRSKEVGEDVTLDCHHLTGLDVTEESVYWEFNNIYVLVFRNRKISNVDQGEQFKGRASEDSSWNPAEGNLSLKILSVKLQDAGTYTCSVRCQTYTCFVRQLNMFCSTRLSITPKSNGQRKDPDGNHGDQGSDITKMVTGIGGGGGGGMGMGMGIGIVGIICIGGLVIWCIKPIRSFFGRIMKSFRHRDQMVKLDPPS